MLLLVARLAGDVPQVVALELNRSLAPLERAVAVDARVRLVPWSNRAQQAVRRLR